VTSAEQTPTRILIVGWPKSGTTALMYKVMGGLDDPHWLFEPKGSFESDLPPDRPLVAKALLSAFFDVDHYATYEPHFPLRVFIRRDPRDVLISLLIWSISSGRLGQEKLEWAVGLLEKKERDPRSVPLSDLTEHPTLSGTNAHLQGLRLRVEQTRRLFEHHGDGMFRFAYEDMVLGAWGELEHYLGFEIDRDREVGWRHTLVARTKGADNWRRWFTPRDVELYRPHIDPMLEFLGYEVEWELDGDPVIPEEEATGYIRARIEWQERSAAVDGKITPEMMRGDP
jgi:hypothetical protein